MPDNESMNTSYFQIESFVPSWLKADAGYMRSLQQCLVNRMLMQGYDVVEGPFVEDHTGDHPAPVPVGMVLLVAWCGVQEFDVEVPMPDEDVRTCSNACCGGWGTTPHHHLPGHYPEPDVEVPMPPPPVRDHLAGCHVLALPRPVDMNRIPAASNPESYAEMG